MRKDSNFPVKTGTAMIRKPHPPCLPTSVRHPHDVLAATDIAPQQKRAILASWASDMFAVESRPDLRLYPEADEPVSYDEIIEALKALDDSDQPHDKRYSQPCGLSSRARHRDDRGLFRRVVLGIQQVNQQSDRPFR